MPTELVIVSLVLAGCLTLFTVVTGVFRDIIKYAFDLIWTFIFMFAFIIGLIHFVSLLP